MNKHDGDAAMVKRLYQEVADVVWTWQAWNRIFVVKDIAAREKLLSVAPQTTAHLGRVFADFVLLKIAALSQPAKYVGLLQTLKRLDQPKGSIPDALRDSIERFVSEVKDVKRHRDERIAHLVSQTRPDQSPLPRIEIRRINDLVHQMVKLTSEFHLHLGMDAIRFRRWAMFQPGEDMVLALEHAVAWGEAKRHAWTMDAAELQDWLRSTRAPKTKPPRPRPRR